LAHLYTLHAIAVTGFVLFHSDKLCLLLWYWLHNCELVIGCRSGYRVVATGAGTWEERCGTEPCKFRYVSLGVYGLTVEIIEVKLIFLCRLVLSLSSFGNDYTTSVHCQYLILCFTQLYMSVYSVNQKKTPTQTFGHIFGSRAIS